MLPIRMRIAAASTVATILVLGGAGLIFLTTLRSGLQNSLDDSLRSSASQLSAQASDSDVPPEAGAAKLVDDTYGQVFSAADSILTTTDDRGIGPLLSPRELAQARTGPRFFDVDLTAAHEERVFAIPVGNAGQVVAVALSRDLVNDTVARAGRQLLLLGAIVLLIQGPGSWLLARSALRPVERMRAQAAELEARDAGGGLDVPVSGDEIGRLGLTLNALLGRLHAALERERAFVADAGHELRTPLTVLKGELELAHRPRRSHAELLATIDVASEETERLIRLAEDLLVLARDEASMVPRWTQLDLDALISSAVAHIQTLADSSGVGVLTNAPTGIVVQADPDRIRQAVDNVLANAVRYAPADSVIQVTIHHGDAATTIEIVDDGPGFAPELIPFAFERFRRGDEVRTRGEAGVAGYPGSGLGLAIVRAVLRSHGGDASVSNRPDRSGARVTLQWPDR